MPNRPIEAHHRKDASRIKSLHSHLNNTAQHGINNHDSCSLLRIPSESLTHITSFLDPPALFALSRANRQLYDHVKDDNTWRRAYAHQSLGISPESDFRDNNDDRALMLRREETTWRKEFVFRYNLRRYVIFLNAEDHLVLLGNYSIVIVTAHRRSVVRGLGTISHDCIHSGLGTTRLSFCIPLCPGLQGVL